MCAILGSFSKDVLQNLIKTNSYRGNHSYSLTRINVITGDLQIIEKSLGKPNLDNVSFEEGYYYLGHVQAPTTEERTLESVHPSEYEGEYLWHNGIIKDSTVKKLQEILEDNTTWDTRLLHKFLKKGGKLEDIEGSFSCARYKKHGIFLFRNQIAPLFYDKDLNISSTRFENCKATPSNTYLWMDFVNRKLATIFTFENKHNPYYF